MDGPSEDLCDLGDGDQERQATNQALTKTLLASLETRARQVLSGWRRSPKTKTPSVASMVNSAWLNIVGSSEVRFETRKHFVDYFAKTMRHILVEEARTRMTAKRGGGVSHVELVLDEVGSTTPEAIMTVDEMLDDLESQSPVTAEIVKLRFFGGFTMPEIAEACESSLREVQERWRFARVWAKAKYSWPSDHNS